jgi:GntR family transcriptional regulator/MocR family aminotransferase
MFLKLDSTGPLYDQIYRSLRSKILEGRIAPGSRAPATRELARELRVSRNVTMMAYSSSAEGYLTSRSGSGTYVASELPQNLTTTARPPDASPAI